MSAKARASHASGSAKETRSTVGRIDGFPEHGCETWPLSDLIQYIVERHHAWLRAELPEIEQWIHRMIASEGHSQSQRFTEIETLFRQFRRETANHLKKEEDVLFPLIERLEVRAASGLPPERQSFGSLRNPVLFMMQDHELANRLLAKMKQLCGEGGAAEQIHEAAQALLKRLKEVEADLATHVQLEDELLFPRAIRLEEAGRPAGV